jgi:hypothetical protein
MTIEIALCGCGAVGSQVALMIARPYLRFTLIDDDRIEADNIETTAFYRQHIGGLKAVVLGELLYRKAGCITRVRTRELIPGNYIDFLGGCDLILDCFDNVVARSLTCSEHTLHIGVSMERTGAVTWNKDYKLYPGLPRGEEQFCTHAAGRRIIRFTAAVAANVIDDWLVDRRQSPAIITTEERIIYVA